MTLENLLQTAKEGFRFYVELATDDPTGAYHWSACLNGVRHMAFYSIGLFYETINEDEAAEAYDILDEAYDQARKEIDNIYRMAVCSKD